MTVFFLNGGPQQNRLITRISTLNSEAKTPNKIQLNATSRDSYPKSGICYFATEGSALNGIAEIRVEWYF